MFRFHFKRGKTTKKTSIIRQCFEQGQGIDIIGDLNDVYLIIARFVRGIEHSATVGSYAGMHVALLPFAGAFMKAEGARLGISLLRQLPKSEILSSAVSVTYDKRLVARENVTHIIGELKGLILCSVEINCAKLAHTEKLLVGRTDTVTI